MSPKCFFLSDLGISWIRKGRKLEKQKQATSKSSRAEYNSEELFHVS